MPFCHDTYRPFLLVSGTLVLFRAARGQGAVRELDRREVPHPTAAPPASAARQRGALLFVPVRGREEGVALVLRPEKTRSSRARYCPAIARRQRRAGQLQPGNDCPPEINAALRLILYDFLPVYGNAGRRRHDCDGVASRTESLLASRLFHVRRLPGTAR